MIDGLIAGKIFGQPKQGQGKNGSYVTAKVRAATEQDTIFVNVICFNQQACSQLLALQDGDSVSVAGSLTPRVWDSQDGPRPVLDMVAHAVLSVYHIRKKRDEVQGIRNHGRQEDFNDDVDGE